MSETKYTIEELADFVRRVAIIDDSPRVLLSCNESGGSFGVWRSIHGGGWRQPVSYTHADIKQLMELSKPELWRAHKIRKEFREGK